MKKTVFFILLACFVAFTASETFAAGIGLKGGYVNVREDLEDADFEDTWNFGVFFDMGTFLFRSLRFKPGFDYYQLENEDTDAEIDVYGIHLDWYWYFMDRKAIAPFLGFGPTLNYYEYDTGQDEEEDSDAGLEGFAGVDFAITGPMWLTVEVRYAWLDIAQQNDESVVKFNVGIMYYF